MRMTDRDYMRVALREAEKAMAEGEVPIGAVIVFKNFDDGVFISSHNRRENEHDATAHAEMIAIREAGRRAGNWRLTGATMYVTLEPCPMCAAAIAEARMERIVYGAPDSKCGAVESVMKLAANPVLASPIEVTAGVMEEECRAIINRFFSLTRDNSYDKIVSHRIESIQG